MQRAFWWGVGCFLILASIAGLSKIFDPRASWFDALVGIVILIVCVPFSIGTIRTARRAPKHASTGQAIGGWLLGFCFLFILAVVLRELISILERLY